MPIDPVKCARRIIHEVKYITIATICADGRPWNTPVYFAFDEDYDFYWISDRAGQHSKNIRENPHVFAVIYNSAIPEGTGAGQGVYIQARATELSDPEQVARAHRLVTARSGRTSFPADCYLGEPPGRLYRATPEALWVNDSAERGGIRVDARVAVGLAALRAARSLPRADAAAGGRS